LFLNLIDENVPEDLDASPFELYIAIAKDPLRIGSIRIAERRLAASPSPLYMSRFDYDSTACGGPLRAVHGIGIGSCARRPRGRTAPPPQEHNPRELAGTNF
jgi:hypothetical protein